MIKVKNLSKKYNDKTVVDNVSVNIKKEKSHPSLGRMVRGKVRYSQP